MSECKLKEYSYLFLFWGESSYFFPIFQNFHSYFPIFCKSFGTWQPVLLIKSLWVSCWVKGANLDERRMFIFVYRRGTGSIQQTGNDSAEDKESGIGQSLPSSPCSQNEEVIQETRYFIIWLCKQYKVCLFVWWPGITTTVDTFFINK